MSKKQKEPVEMIEVPKASIEAMADNIAAIAKAAREMERHLTRRALVVLLNDQTGGVRGVSKENITKVLDALQNLDAYVKRSR